MPSDTEFNKILEEYINNPQKWPTEVLVKLSEIEETLKNDGTLNYKSLQPKNLIKFCENNFDCCLGYDLLSKKAEEEDLTEFITLSFCKRMLLSCHTSTRLVALEFLKKFNLVVGEYLDYLINGEKLVVDLNCFQEKGKLFRKLQYGNHKKVITNEEDEEIILRVLLAQYSVNFSIYWPKIDEIVSTFARGMDGNKFFNIWKEFYDFTTKNKDVDPYAVSNIISSKKNQNQNRGDRYLIRLSLIKVLSLSIGIVENNFVDVVNLFNDLYFNEFKYKDPNLFLTVNLINPAVKEKEIPLDEALAHARSIKIKDMVVEFCNLLSRVPKLSAHDKKNIVKDIVDHMLLDGDSRLLNPAIQIIKNFRYKYVHSYIETFEGLGDQHKFKNTLLKFQLTFDELSTDKFVHENHRSDLMKLIVKMLYGKIIHSKNDSRKSMFQFLAVLNDSEVDMFLELIYKKIIHYFAEYFEGKVFNIEKFEKDCLTFDMHSFINPYVIKHMLDYTGLIIQNMRMKLSPENIVHISDVCLLMLACVTKYFEFFKKIDKEDNNSNEEHINFKYNGILKDIRKQVTQMWVQIFSNFGRQPFLTEAKFQYFWNELVTKHTVMKIKSVGHLDYSHSINVIFPDHILKFFSPLFPSIDMLPLFNMMIGVKNSKYTDMYPILFNVNVTEVLTNSLLSNYVMAPLKDEIVTGFCNIAESQTIQETSEFLKKYNTTTGNDLINKYAKNIGNYLSFYLENNESYKKMKVIELKLLSIVSRSIPHELANQFIKLFVYYLQHNSYSDETVVVDILKIISQLLVLVNESTNKDNYIWMIPIIIPLLSSRLLRIGFIKVLRTIKTLKIVVNDEDLIQQLNILEMLNDPGTSNIGFETFDRRLEGYDLLKQFDEAKKLLNKDIFKSLLLTNDYFITKNTDLSCNQSAEYSSSDLLIHLASASYTEEYKKEILDVYESLISKRVRVKQEDVRNSYIKILSTYVTSFQHGYKYSPLYALKTLAPDFDFFEEIVSIQLNVKQKAFTLLTEWIHNNGSMFNEIIFYQIIIPIAKPYMDDIHKDKTTLSDEAIKLFGAVIEHTKWKKFNFVINGLIKRLLKATENVQVRLLVKQLNVCLDGFKTDLRNIKEEEALFDTSLEPKKRNDVVDDVVIYDTIEKMDTNEGEEDFLESMDVTENETIEEDKLKYNESIEIVKQFESYTIPKLVSIINCDNLNIKKTTTDGKKVYVEDYYILRAPIVLPLVRVLIKMPDYIIKKYKHGVINKLCSLLICHTPDIREKARKIMVEVSLTFGPQYLSFIIYEIGKLLKKGFQAHVGIYTIHTILISQKNLKPGDLDNCYKLLIDNCFLDQFSIVAEEKEVHQITSKCPEAKENKSKFIYRILGQNCNIEAFEYFEAMSLDQLNETPNSETFRKIYSNCESLAHGAAKNICIPSDKMMRYALTIFDKHLENCLKKKNIPNEEDEWESRRPRDCYLLEAEPKRLGQMAKTAQKSRNTVFIALALQLVAGTLEKKKLDSSKEENKKMIEQFVPILLKCMELRSDKLQNYSLNCILNLFNNFDLPILNEHMNDFLNQLFIILKNVSGTTSANNDLKQKLFIAFKLFVGNKKPVSFSDKQIKILFANIKIEMFSQSVQANAMNILKEVVKSKIGYDQIGEIMEFCISQAIQSTVEKLRDSTRNVIKIYIKHNPKVDHSKVMSFVMDQFQYSLPHGRKSALELFTIFLDYLDKSTWDKEGLTCFIRLSLLFDDDDVEVQNYARLTMINLFEKSSGSVQSDIMEGIMKLISSKKIQIFLSGMKGLVSISRSPYSNNISKEILDSFIRIVKIKFTNASTIFTDKYFEVFIQEFFMFFEKMHSYYEMKDVFDNEFLEILLNITISIENEHIIQNVYKLFFYIF